MQHRHLSHEQYTLAAIDDIIARGKRPDWAELRQAALASSTEQSWLGCMKDTGVIVGDIVCPAESTEAWEVAEEAKL